MSQRVLSHVILGTNRVAEAMEFYDRVLAILGHERRWQGESGAGYGRSNEQSIDTFWISKPLDGNLATVGNGSNVCFISPSRNAVDEFYSTALELGATDEGPPGIREEVHELFYACYIRDLDGNKIVVACHDKQ